MGLVMAKGVVLGVIACITILPAMILVFDKLIEKTRHRPLLPKMDKFVGFVTKRSWIFLVVFLIALVPAFYGYRNAKVYYELSEALPKDMENIVATTKLQETFDMASTHMILADAKLSAKDAKAMIDVYKRQL